MIRGCHEHALRHRKLYSRRRRMIGGGRWHGLSAYLLGDVFNKAYGTSISRSGGVGLAAFDCSR